MFVENLNLEQQGYLVGLSKLLAGADGVVTDDERLMIQTIEQQCDSNIIVPDDLFNNICATFSDQPSKVSLLLEILSIAFADDEYNEDERGLIKKIASSLDVSSSVLGEMEQWVEKQFSLIKDAKALMGA